MRFVPSQQLNVNFHPHYVPCDFFVENVSVLLGRRMHVGSHPAALIYRGGLFMPHGYLLPQRLILLY